MIALVCEKKKFENALGEVYFTLLLSVLNEKSNEFHVFNVKDKNGSYVSLKHFVPPEVYDSVCVCNLYDFSFAVNPANGRANIVAAKPYKV